MAVAIASSNQYLFRRNFNENKWAPVGKGVCKIQVMEKSGEFYFKFTDGSEVRRDGREIERLP